MAASKPLVEGKKYHFHVIYNHAKSMYVDTADTKLSLNFVVFLVGKLKEWGYTECYYYDEHAGPGKDVFDELFSVVNASQWTFVIITKDFSSNLWVNYCKKAAFKNLMDKTQIDKLIPIIVGNVKTPDELELNSVLSFSDDPTTWDQKIHIRLLTRLQRVLDENISVAATADVVPVQDHGDGRVRSERGHSITESQHSIQESPSDLNTNSHLEVDGSTGFENTDSSTHHPNANDGIEEMGQNTNMNPARTSNHHYPQSVLAHSPTTDTATNIQGEQVHTDTCVKKTSVSNTENTHNRASQLDITARQDSVDGLTVEEVLNRQCDVTTSMAAGCIPRPELSQDKTEQNKDVDSLPYEVEYPEQRMKKLKFDRGGKYVDNLSLSEDQDLTLDQDWSNLQHENISTTEQTRPEELLNDFTQRSFEQEGPTLLIDSLINNGSNEQGELTEPKHITSSSDAGYISADNISNNSISSSDPGKHHWEVHTDSSDRMDVKPSSVESDPKTHRGNSKYSGDVKSGNKQMDVVDLMKKERLVCTRVKESKPEEVTDKKNKDKEVPVRGEGPRPVGSEVDTSFSMISTSRSMARDIDGYREVLLRSFFHSITKTDMFSSWS